MHCGREQFNLLCMQENAWLQLPWDATGTKPEKKEKLIGMQLHVDSSKQNKLARKKEYSKTWALPQYHSANIRIQKEQAFFIFSHQDTDAADYWSIRLSY